MTGNPTVALCLILNPGGHTVSLNNPVDGSLFSVVAVSAEKMWVVVAPHRGDGIL